MAKGKKSKKDKKKKKSREEKLPTQLAGVQLPPELRQVAAAATEVMRHPVVADIVSAGILAAVAALAENESVRRDVGETAEDAADEVARTARRAKVAAKAAAGAIGQRLLDEVKVAAGAKKPRPKAPARAD